MRWPASLHLKKGEYLSIRGLRAAANRLCLAILGCSILRATVVRPERQAGAGPEAFRARAHPQSRNRIIFQAFNLIGDLTVYENVELPLTYRGMPSAERKKRVHDALERVGMSHRIKHYPSQLSGGQHACRVARALAATPPSCWPTSPTGNLDSTKARP